MRALLLVAILVVGCGGTAAPSAPQSGGVSPAGATSAPTATPAATPPPTSAAPSAAQTATPTAAAATMAPSAAPTVAPTPAPTRAPTPTVAPPTPAVTNPPTPGARVPLKVVEFGFSEVSGPVYYGIVVENPNTEWAVFGTGVEITFLDAGGKEITTVGGLIANLLPGQTAAIGDNSYSGAGAKSMKVELIEGEWVPMAAAPEPLSVSDVVTRTTGGQMTTTGTITSTSSQPMDFVLISVIYRNAAGKIIGGAQGITQVAPAGETPFEIRALEPLPAKATEVYLSY